jgi:hypothetical protein
MGAGTARRQAQGGSVARRLLALALGITLLGAVLTGCGQAATNIPPPQNCGTVQLRGIVLVDGASAGQAETCFYQAFQQCQRASLAVNEMGVDAGTDRVFSTASGSGSDCIISDMVTTYVVPTQHNTTKTYTCASLSRKDGGLLFSSCGADGDVYVPASANG